MPDEGPTPTAPPPARSTRGGVTTLALLLTAALLLGAWVVPATAQAARGPSVTWSLPGTTGTVRVTTSTSPATTTVRDDLGTLATFTRGARTVSLRGPQRHFAESTTSAVVRTTTWVRLLAQPFDGRVDPAWLGAALQDRSPDVLAVARQYTTGAPDLVDASGLRVAGDASYGPVTATGRAPGSDFNDYLQIPWTYGSTVDHPEPDQAGALDCSGYVRMVLGYRLGLPLALAPNGRGVPRRSFEILASAPGVVLVPDTGVRPAVPASLTAGDLVFFDASTDDGTRIDHVGIYLGVDSAGAPRFLSSRATVDGPTMGDVAGRSTLSGIGLYARSLRAVRRV